MKAEIKPMITHKNIGKILEKQEEKNPVLAFGEACLDAVNHLKQFREQTCIDLARKEDKETVRRLLKSNNPEDQIEVGRLAARGLFEK